VIVPPLWALHRAKEIVRREAVRLRGLTPGVSVHQLAIELASARRAALAEAAEEVAASHPYRRINQGDGTRRRVRAAILELIDQPEPHRFESPEPPFEDAAFRCLACGLTQQEFEHT
jgi:hypothetical protein